MDDEKQTDISTIENLLDDYLLKNIVRPDTQITYTKVANTWIKDTGLHEVGRISEKAVINWRSQVLSRASPQTFNNYRAHLRALWNHAKRKGLCSSNPFSDVPPAPVVQTAAKTVPVATLLRIVGDLERQEAHALQPNWFWALVIKVFYYTGMRRRQLVGLAWGDFDPKRNIIRLSSATSKTHREWEIPISEELGQYLIQLKYITKQAAGRAPAHGEQIFNVTLFNSRYEGKKMTVGQVSGAFNRLSKIYGQKISAHRLRHTTATMLVNKTKDYRAVQSLLGHTNISTTLGYVRPDTEQMRSAVQTLDEL